MNTPKSEKLKKEEADPMLKDRPTPNFKSAAPIADVIKIKPIVCCNENVAILCFRQEVGGGLILPADEGFKSEGIVVGTGPGIPDGAGGRTKSQLKLGDVVAFPKGKQVVEIKPESGPYKDQLVLLLNERSLLMQLPPRPFEVVTDA